MVRYVSGVFVVCSTMTSDNIAAMPNRLIHVVAAVIHDGENIVLAKRPDHVHKGGLWEFPGGKVETGEDVKQALIRELNEELGIVPTSYRPLIRIPYHYPDKSVLLDVWVVKAWDGKLHGREGQAVQSVGLDQLDEYAFPEANAPIVTACQLPEYYLITPPFQGDEKVFLRRLEHALQQGMTLVQFRQPALPLDTFSRLADKVIDTGHRSGARVLLNTDIATAQSLGADGVHLNSRRLREVSNIEEVGKEFLVAASCHSYEELSRAAEGGCDFAVLGPVLETASHPGQPPLGWDRFTAMVDKATIPVYALGGMRREMVRQSRQAGGQGIAAISSLWPSEVP